MTSGRIERILKVLTDATDTELGDRKMSDTLQDNGQQNQNAVAWNADTETWRDPLTSVPPDGVPVEGWYRLQGQEKRVHFPSNELRFVKGKWYELMHNHKPFKSIPKDHPHVICLAWRPMVYRYPIRYPEWMET